MRREGLKKGMDEKEEEGRRECKTCTVASEIKRGKGGEGKVDRKEKEGNRNN